MTLAPLLPICNMRLRLKIKLVLAISGMVLVLVSVLSYVYLSQLLRQRITEAYEDGDFIAHQIYQVSRDALDVDLSNLRVDENNPDEVRKVIEASLAEDPGYQFADSVSGRISTQCV